MKLRLTTLMVLCMCIVAAGTLFAGGRGETRMEGEPAAWQQIQWNEPVSMAERLDADEYILPSGWEEATSGVKELVAVNVGGRAGDIATVINMRMFERLTGIKVVLSEVPPDVLYAKTLSTLISRDKSIDLPGVDGPEMLLSSYAAGDWLQPVDVIYEPESEVLKLYSPAIKAYKYDGHWMGSPGPVIGFLWFYRPSILKKAGVSEVPSTYAGVYEAAKKVRDWAKANNEDIAGIVFSGASGSEFIFDFRAAVYAQGGRLYQDGKYQFLSPEVKNAMKWYTDLIKEGIASKAVLSTGSFDSGRTFGVGKAAFASVQISAYAMQFQSQYPEIKGDWAAFASPKWDNNTPEEYRAGPLATSGLMIPNYIDDKRQAAGMLLIDYLRSKQACRNELLVEGNETFYKSLYKDPEIDMLDWDLIEEVAAELELSSPPARLDSLPMQEARALMVETAVSEVYPPGFSKVVDKLMEVFDKTATGELSVEEGLKQVQKTADTVSQ